jgi:hypothetical protein
MEQGRHSMDVIADETGFGDQKLLRRAFLRTLGQPPRAIRRNASAGWRTGIRRRRPGGWQPRSRPLDQGCRERWKNSNITTVRRADRSGFVADMRPVTGEIFHPKIQPWSLFGSD